MTGGKLLELFCLNFSSRVRIKSIKHSTWHSLSLTQEMEATALKEARH